MPEMTKTLYFVIYILFKHASVWGREKTNAELRQVIPSIVIALAGRCACLWRHAFLQLLFLHLQENRAHCLFDEACSYLKKTSTVWSNWENMSARTKIHQCSVCFEIVGFFYPSLAIMLLMLYFYLTIQSVTSIFALLCESSLDVALMWYTVQSRWWLEKMLKFP